MILVKDRCQLRIGFSLSKVLDSSRYWFGLGLFVMVSFGKILS